MTHDRVIDWMSEHGHREYADAIHNLECTKWEIKGDAGRYWQFCQFTLADLAKIDREIEEIKQHALDRYEDWASD